MLTTKDIFLLASLLCFFSFLVLFSFKGNGVTGVRQVLLGSVLGMAGNILYAFGKELPVVFAYEVANLTYAAALAAVFVGYRNLFKRPAYSWPLAFALVVFTGLIAYFHYIVDSFAARTFLASLFYAALGGGIAWTVVQCWHEWDRPSYPKLFILAVSSLIAAGHVSRIVHQLLAGDAPKSLLEPSAENAMMLAAGAFALPVLALGAVLLAHRHIVLMAENAANRDYLTGAWSRRAFYEMGERERVRALRTGQALTMLLIDMDNFKPINDTYGHDAGDKVLELFVRQGMLELRRIDYLCRMGGDEFAVLMPDTTLAGAQIVAGRLKSRIEEGPRPDFMAGMTLSIGIATLGDGDDLGTLVKRADRALYAAKHKGRNQIASESDTPPPRVDPLKSQL